MEKDTDAYRDSLWAVNSKTSDMVEVFKVAGSGEIQISKSDQWQCGGVAGFSIGV